MGKAGLAAMEPCEFDWSVHARLMLEERCIQQNWVIRTLKKPENIEADQIDQNISHALARIPEHGDRVLRVVYNSTVKPWRIVTVFFDRRAARKP